MASRKRDAAEAELQRKQYAYKNNMNLVLKNNSGSRRNFADEGTGEAQRVDARKIASRMGDRVRRSSDLNALKLKAATKRLKRQQQEEEEERAKKKIKREVFAAESSILTAQLENLNYVPKTKTTRVAYEEMLSFVHKLLGDVPQDILRGAVDEVISTLKDVDMKSSEKQSEIESLLTRNVKFDVSEYSKLVAIGKRITDFKASEDKMDVDQEEDEEKIDDALGVAVVFEEEDEDDRDTYEIRDEDENSDEGDENGVDTKSGNALKGGNVGGESDEDDDEEEGDLNPNDIDAQWLQRELRKYYKDANLSQKLSDEVLNVLHGEEEESGNNNNDDDDDDREVENKLVILLDYDKFDFIKILLQNRAKISYCMRLHRCSNQEEREKIEREMSSDLKHRGPEILEALRTKDTATNWAKRRSERIVKKSRKEARQLSQKNGGGAGGNSDNEEMELATAGVPEIKSIAERVLDLKRISFNQESRLMTSKRCELPPKSWRAQKKGYEEVHVPPMKTPPMPKGERLVNISELPKWARKAFEVSNMTKLNRVQSALYEKAFKSPDNLLLCAPTGAGKTNVAVLTMLETIGRYLDQNSDKIDKSKFKIVYVAPMKALVQECVVNFGKRLGVYGITVKELSGDVQLTKAQIAETQVIVTTPEKWDIVTRKSGDRTYTQLVRLLIIDEIHLLHDPRGAVLESIVARTIRQVETTQDHVRIVGLSATLPNYEDVALFCRVEEDGLFHFDNGYRPVPLQQQYIGITEKKALKRLNIMNEICYEKVMDFASEHQIIVFVHSRKDTAKTARVIRDMAVERDEIDVFVSDGDAAVREILRTESENTGNADLKELLPYGFGIHHAGLKREDRSLVEDLFADGSIRVLCSTATLAWGVNLPAHTVIIKGTQVYDPEKGKWVELSYLDIMQMFGRAGRPQYDSRGEGIMITTHNELQYYLSLMNEQLPVESQMIARLPDSLNAEIVMGTIQNVQEAVQWISYTYLFVRMLRNPKLYGIEENEMARDPHLEQRRVDLVHTAATLLAKHGLVRYDTKSGALQATPLGRVASHFYITHHSVATFNEYLKPTMSEIELFNLFSLSYEFRNIVIRQEEKMELQKLLDRVPIPVKEGIEEPSAKVNVLLQAYISQLRLDGFALLSDMVYVRQSAGRIMRALFEVAVCRKWARMAEKTLQLCKMIDKRVWLSHTPLRQFRSKVIPSDVLRKIERKSIGWERYYDLKPQDIGELIRMPKMGKKLYRVIHQFPRLELSAHVQPITRSVLRVELRITPDFQMDPKIHNWGEAFHVFVQDVDGERLLHHEIFLLPCHLAEQEHVITFTVPMFDPMPPQYFIKLVSDRWLHAESTLPVSFRHLLLPNKFPPHTELLDLRPLPVTALRDPVYQVLYSDMNESLHFNPIQTQVFSCLYEEEEEENVLVAAPSGSDKIVCAEFAILRMLKTKGDSAKCVYVSPKEELARIRYERWSAKFGAGLKRKIVMLTGETQTDLKLLKQAHVVICTPGQWDSLSKQWRKKADVRNISLFVVDQLHLVGGRDGPTLEVIVSRMRYIASQVKHKIRIVALSASVANARTLGEWIGAKASTIFSFHPRVRELPTEIHIQGFSANSFGSRMLAMSKPTYNSIMLHASRHDENALVFVPSRRQAQLTAIDIMAYAKAIHEEDQFICNINRVENALETRLRDSSKALRITTKQGVGFLHTGMTSQERRVLKQLYKEGSIRVLVVQKDLCWGVSDVPITDVLQMVGLSGRRGKDTVGNVVVLCHNPKKVFLKRFLHESLPVESHFDLCVHDTMNAEIVNRTLENKQDAVDYMTWTFYYRRLTQNPNYYNMAGRGHEHVSDHLSELIEDTLSELVESKCIACEDEMNLSPLNLGMIASYYSVRYTTIEIFATSVQIGTKIRGMLKILSAASEFDDLAVSVGTASSPLEKMIKHLPSKIDPSAEPQARKANALLQAHFGRVPVSFDLREDQRMILRRSVKLLRALVDVISSMGWLKPALAAMELIQMIVQARWSWDNALLQIPHFDKDIVGRIENYNKNVEDEDDKVENVFDILELEDEDRNELLRLNGKKMSDVARFCNAYPNVEMEYEVVKDDEEEISTKSVVRMIVKLSRDEDDVPDDLNELGKVVAPSYPENNLREGWWLVVGDSKSNTLLSIKRVSSLKVETEVKLAFQAPKEVGDHKLSLFLMCDSYLRCDQQYDFELSVVDGGEDSSSGSGSESEDDV